MKNKKGLLLIILILMLCGCLSVITGTTFAFFAADLKGNVVNEVNTSDVKLIYSESNKPSTVGVMEDNYAITEGDSFSFSLNTEADNDVSYEYYIYLVEEPGNTIPPENIKIFLTDSENIPATNKYINLNNKYCYDYYNKRLYDESSDNYKKCQTLNIADGFYMMDKNYYGNVNNVNLLKCRKYYQSENEIKNEFTDVSKCQYGEVYKGTAVKYTDLESDAEVGITNVILKGTYKNIKGVSYYNGVKFSTNTKEYKIKVWANGLENDDVEDASHEVTSTKDAFKYKVNVYAKQVALDY